MTTKMIHLGYAVGAGEAVEIPLRHMAVTGQTQESGKTTALEALVSRLPKATRALAFITKRGEGSFQQANRVQPYFRDRADWQFVTSILDATLQEKNKFLRPWIIKICRTTKTLAEVQKKVQDALLTAKGVHEGVYTQLDAYLSLIVPEIKRAELATELTLHLGLNVMDVSSFDTPMQMLFIQSALDWVNEREKGVVVIIPEAWEFIPEGKGSPVKASAIALVRKGAGLRNFIWVDSQDMAGVDKTILRGCAVWLIGVQREANEIKRNLDNIPANVKKPKAVDVAMQRLGEFYACWGAHCVHTYVQPIWLGGGLAQSIAKGEAAIESVRFAAPNVVTDLTMQGRGPSRDEIYSPATTATQTPGDPEVKASEAEALRRENAELKSTITRLERAIEESKPPAEDMVRYKGVPVEARDLMRDPKPHAPIRGELVATAVHAPIDDRSVSVGFEVVPFSGEGGWGDEQETLYQAIKARLLAEAPDEPVLLRLLTTRPELQVKVKREVLDVEGDTVKGRVARLIAANFFADATTHTAVRKELKRTGSDANDGTLDRVLKEYVRRGFLFSLGKGVGYQAAPGMKATEVAA